MGLAVRARAAAEGVGGPQDLQGVCPGCYVAVHLAGIPATVVAKLQQRVEASNQACPAFLLQLWISVSANLYTAKESSEVCNVSTPVWLTVTMIDSCHVEDSAICPETRALYLAFFSLRP